MKEDDSKTAKRSFLLPVVAVLVGLSGGYYFLHWPPSTSSKFAQFIDDKTGGIDWGDEEEEPPLTHLSSGFKCVRFVGAPKFESVLDLFKQTEYGCEWGWQYEVRNNLDRPVKVSVQYELEDADEFILATSEGSVRIEAGETEKIIEVAEEPIPLSDLKRVYRMGWRIWHQ
ncbi:hypothetical protein GS610_05405 [Ruegeria sp. HKCCD6228]|uniref:hypothetical protein n=1 Tax=Ruegeria sp. HKCCD6228 TaxID=2683001 RepID=UPI0014912C6D|nr:hypothetical protein [Ruegeria sp. HKCCD6228]NOD96641.1 hypothetical protein [Ruegeria sp. HKCCD6228]